MTGRGLLATAAAATAASIVLLLLVPATGYQLSIVAMVAITALVGIGLNVLVGLTGQVSLGHVAFYAIGAYVVAILDTRLAWSFWIALPLAGVVAGLAGAVLSIPALRVRGPYLAMLTIAFAFVVEQVAAEWVSVTGGWNGIGNIARPSMFGTELAERGIAILSVSLMGACLVLYGLLVHSPLGQAMRATRDSELAAQSVGIDPLFVKATAFSTSAAFAGIAGGIFAVLDNYISPESFPLLQSILFLLAVVIGGAEFALGPLIGALIVVLLPALLSKLAGYRLLFVGGLLLLMLRLAPQGFAGLLVSLWRRFVPARPSSPVHRTDAEPLAYNGAKLEARGLGIAFGGVSAVADLDFAAEAGRITSLIGPNGAGKSTALNLFCGFYTPDAGTVTLGGREVAREPAHRIALAGLGRTYQTTQLFSHMSVLENVLVAIRGARRDARMLAGMASDEERSRAESLLRLVGYTGVTDRLAASLPHVDKRLVEIARALAMKPRVLALDEPAAGLDAEDKARLGALLQRLARAGLTVILVEHDMSLVMGVSDRVVVLDAGRKIAEGAPLDVSRDPKVLRAYLGEGRVAEKERTIAKRAAPKAILDVRSLYAGYGAINVLRDVSLSVGESELVAVLGANGAGKSTLLRALAGLNRPVFGEILLDGERIDRLGAAAVCGRGLVLVPEGRQVFPELTTLDNLRIGAYRRTDGKIDADVERLLDRFPRLRERIDRRAGLLSGGEQQMLAIARGLIGRPRVLMLDEPSLGLAPALVAQLYELIDALRADGTTVLLVDQNASLALSIADRGYVLKSGRIAHAGTATELLEQDVLTDAYVGPHTGEDAFKGARP